MANGSKKSGAQPGHEVDEVLLMRQKKAAAAASAQHRVPSQDEYERRERLEAQQHLAALRRQPLSDRKEAQAKFLEAMRVDPELVAERIGWLINGSYGYGAMLLAKQVLASPRMNRSAALTQMVGAFEWMAPEDMVRAAWKMLTKPAGGIGKGSAGVHSQRGERGVARLPKKAAPRDCSTL